MPFGCEIFQFCVHFKKILLELIMNIILISKFHENINIYSDRSHDVNQPLKYILGLGLCFEINLKLNYISHFDKLVIKNFTDKKFSYEKINN